MTPTKPDTPRLPPVPAGSRLPDDAEWQALLARRRDGAGGAVYGVMTMHIHCRFGCPSRPPLRRHVVLFDQPASAEAAGFRACKRCGGWPAYAS